MYYGVELAIEEINETGGIAGRPLHVIKSDHHGNPARGVANIKQLAQQKNLLAVVGGVHTPVAIAQLDAIHDENILYLGAWAAGTAVVDNNYTPNNVFRVSVRDSEAATVLLNYAKSRGLTKVALALERTAWGRSNFASLDQAASKLGIDIVKTAWVNWQQVTFALDAASIADSESEAIIMVANAPEAAVMTRAIHAQLGDALPIIAHWGLASGDFTTLVGKPLLTAMDISVIQTFSFLYQTSPQAQKLLHRYRARFAADIDASAVPAAVGVAHGYDLTHLLARAAQSAENLNTDALRDALENLPSYEGAVKTYAPPFTPTRHDALWAQDYFMARFNGAGNLIPVKR